MLKIVGQISSADEANEIEFITKSFVVWESSPRSCSAIKNRIIMGDIWRLQKLFTY